jgi:hypothetical protein
MAVSESDAREQQAGLHGECTGMIAGFIEKRATPGVCLHAHAYKNPFGEFGRIYNNIPASASIYSQGSSTIVGGLFLCKSNFGF